MTVAFSGMVATVGLPNPWGLVTSGGVMVRAHGTVTNQDTTSYTASFSGLVPVSGTRTAYLAATVLTIQQNPVPIPGPPPGHPSWNPNFVPTVGYASQVYSVALTAVSGAPDNVNSFELFRTTLTPAQTTLSAYDTRGWQRAADRKAWPMQVLASGGVLTVPQAQSMLAPAVSGLTHTLPPVSGAGGLMYGLVNPTNGNWTISTTGTDRILGETFGVGVASTTVPASGAALLWGDALAGVWFMMGSSDDSAAPGMQTFTANGSFTVPPGVTMIEVELVGGGGGGGGAGGASAAGGGGAGGYAAGKFTVVPGTVYTVTVGLGGTAGANTVTDSANNGGNGGTTSFGGLLSATGGHGGTGAASGGSLQGAAQPGGAGTGGSVNAAGGRGYCAFFVGPTVGFGGAGGNSFFGGGGSASTGQPDAGQAPGSGAAGGGPSWPGGIGAPGLVTVRW